MASKNGTARAIEGILIPDVLLDIGGRVRHLRMDYNALALLEQELGVDCLDYEKVSTVLTSQRVTERRAVLWALLVDDDPTLDVREVGRWLGFQNRTEVDGAILNSYRAAVLGSLDPLPSELEVDEEAAGEAPAGRDQAGETSGAQPATISDSATSSSDD